MFGLLMLLMIVLFICSILYISKNIQKLNFISKIEDKYRKWIISFIPIVIVFFAFDVLNSMIIIIHLFFIMLLLNIFNKIIKGKIDKNICVILSLCFTVVFLGYGMYQEYNVRETKYQIKTNKNINDFRIIQISDAHIGTTFNASGFKEYVDKINKRDADIVVVTGDFIDDSTSLNDISSSCEALSELKTKYGVYFVFGNHDLGYSNAINLKSELEKTNVIVLEDEVINVTDNIYIVGRKDYRYIRKDIKDLVKDIDKSKYIIDLNHQPTDYENEKNNVDLVLSGHTHGGQLFPLKYIGSLLKVNDSFYGLETRGNTNYIVSSGISNWALHFKTGTYSEYVIIDIKGNNYE